MVVPAQTGRPFQALFRMTFRNKLNQRRDRRVRYRAPFYLLWDEDSCQPRYVKVLSSEVSERGMSVETSQFVPLDARILLRSDTGAMCGGAWVKHVTQRGPRYLVGLELSYSLLDDARDLVREVYSSPGVK